MNYKDFDEIAETALVEESAIVSKQDRYKHEGTGPSWCNACGKIGHASSKYFSKDIERELRHTAPEPLLLFEVAPQLYSRG
jgi:hypothetical protein